MPYKNIEIDIPGYSQQNTDANTHFYKGFSTRDAGNKGGKLYDFELIKQNILNHFNTRKGERVMNPNFGTIIWDLLMEPLTPEIRNALVNDIQTIVNFDPRVYPLQVDVNEYERGFLVELTLALKNTNETSTLRVAFDQQIGLVRQ